MFAASKSGSVDAKDPQFNYVTMLLHGNGTNGAQNNTFLDSSTNNFTITRNGNTTQGTFTPYGDNWSNYFGGSQSLSNGTNVTASGDFTLECWLNLSSYSAARIFFSVGNETANRRAFFIDSSGVIKIDLASVGATSLGGSIPTNTWTHLAITRSSNTVTAYVNGVATGTTATISGTFGNANGFYVGSVSDNSNSMVGYISNLRWVLGSVVYTSAFTPSTTPLTAITNTSLLTCQSNRFVDNSSSPKTITVNGSPSVQRFSPFSPTTAYSTSVIGGSGYFDGSGDYLSLPNNAALSPEGGDFCIETWVYLAALPASYTHLYVSNTTNGVVTYISSSGTVAIGYSGNFEIAATTATVSLNTWTHIAFSRSGTTVRIFLNGVQSASATNSTTFTSTVVGSIGFASGFNYFNGYLSNVRFVKGSAVYTSAFTPPTAPLTAITNTSLLTNFTNAGILDNAQMNDLETVGNAQISTSVKKYGTGSLAFDGAGDYLFGSANQNVALGTGDFTVEAWLYVTTFSTTTGFQAIFSNRNSSSAQASFDFGIRNSDKYLYFYNRNTDSSTFSTSGLSGINTWIHVAIVRVGTTVTFYINGTSAGTVSVSTNSFGSSNVAYIGSNFNATPDIYNGYIDDLRISKVARYTANFTAPTAAFADKG